MIYYHIMKKPHFANGIKGWPESERPRERMLRYGAEALSDAELVAILLGRGVRGKDAVSYARDIITQSEGLRGLFALSWNRLRQIKGLGSARIATLLASAEIAKRQLRESMIGQNVIRDPESVMNYLYASMRDKKREVFKILFLNKANGVIDEKDMFEGTVDETAIHPREVIQAALERHATSLILVHNHPSGRIRPSAEDREITSKLQTACHAVSIAILDHIIIGNNQYFSFKEHHLL